MDSTPQPAHPNGYLSFYNSFNVLIGLVSTLPAFLPSFTALFSVGAKKYG